MRAWPYRRWWRLAGQLKILEDVVGHGGVAEPVWRVFAPVIQRPEVEGEGGRGAGIAHLVGEAGAIGLEPPVRRSTPAILRGAFEVFEEENERFALGRASNKQGQQENRGPRQRSTRSRYADGAACWCS